MGNRDLPCAIANAAVDAQHDALHSQPVSGEEQQAISRAERHMGLLLKSWHTGVQVTIVQPGMKPLTRHVLDVLPNPYDHDELLAKLNNVGVACGRYPNRMDAIGAQATSLIDAMLESAANYLMAIEDTGGSVTYWIPA